MVLVSSRELQGIAQAIRPHITPYIEENGQITDLEVKALIKQHCHRNIGSERSMLLIQQYLCEC